MGLTKGGLIAIAPYTFYTIQYNGLKKAINSFYLVAYKQIEW